MNKHTTLTAVAILSGACMVLAGCGGTDTPKDAGGSASVSASPSASASASKSAPQVPVQKVSPNQKQSQAPAGGQTGPAAPVWKPGDEQKAVQLAVKVVSAYGSGKSKQAWLADLDPLLTAEAKQVTSQIVDPAPLRMTVQGSGAIESGSKTPYTAWVTVQTDKGPWSVQVRRDATQHKEWLANEVVPTQARQ